MILIVDLIIILIIFLKILFNTFLYQYLKISQQYMNIFLNKNKNKNNLMHIVTRVNNKILMQSMCTHDFFFEALISWSLH